MVRKIMTGMIVTLLTGAAASAQVAQVDSLAITPETITVAVGDTVAFAATAFDGDGLEVEAEITWSVDGGIGVIDTTGVFVADTTGTGTVTAAVETITADAAVTVAEPVAPGPDHIAITPADAEVAAGDTVAFSALVYDIDGNALDVAVIWSIDGGIGVIDTTGVFVADTAGTGTVTAAVETITADAAVTVAEPIAPGPDHIAITPADAEVAAGDTVAFSAVVYDIDGNVLDVAVIWSIDGGIGVIDTTGVFVAENQGMGYVIAQAGDVAESLELHVNAGQGGNGQTPEAVHVYPANAIVVVGGTVQFEVAVTGPDDEEIEDAEIAWSVIDGTVGAIDGDGLFSAAAVGETGVIAMVADISDTAMVTVVGESPVTEAPTITVKREFPNGSIKNFGAPVSVGETLVLGGIPHPFNYLNGTHIYFPEGCISEDILLMIRIPEFGRVQGNSVEFDGDILTAVTFDVLVDGEVVHPFEFDVPVEVTLPYKYGLLKKMGVDPATLGMYFVGQDGQLYREGIENTEMDGTREGITAKVAHFSNLALAPQDAPTVVDAMPAPAEFALGANYPNPFNPETTITYSLGTDSDIRLDVFSITGQHIRTLASGMTAAGTHSVAWDGADNRGNRVTSGVYIYRITAGAFTQSRKLMLMK